MKVSIYFFLVIICLAFQEKKSTDELLKNPFDLQKFKKAKGQSNSGLADAQSYYFQSDKKGIYFRFFLFLKKMGYVYSGNEDKKYAVKPGSGFQIVTYKPLGKYRDDYFDPTETLIEVTASYNDHDLPELAFIGLDTLTIKKKLGHTFIRKDDCFIYSKDSNALILKVSEGHIKCLKYTRLNTTVSEGKIPEGLTAMDCSNQPIR